LVYEENIIVKQIVYYSGLASDLTVGQSALVYPVDHPSEWVSNKEIAQTSTVEAILDCGVFRTSNTEYRPVQMLNA
jgi:hypothetical protein